eukprot:Hpha_TRINITY_DN16516_c1_g9::TRINITY_DN16516_c1_g9_i1::g.136777::m.136777/K10744/RNASEH2B; ribonuclease H2 subunit B
MADEESEFSDCAAPTTPATPDDQAPNSVCADSTTTSKVQQRLVLCPKGQGPVSVFTLPGSRTGAPRKYATRGSQFFEVRKYLRPCSSWFIESTVVKDGALWHLSPSDPLFPLIIVLFRTAAQAESQRYVAAEEIFAGELSVLRTVAESSLPLICDVQEVDDEKYFSPSRQKAIVWLRVKLARIAATPMLEEWYKKDAGALGEATPSAKDMKLQGMHLIHDYTPASLFTELCKAEGIDPQEFEKAQGRVRKSYKELFAERDADLKRQKQQEEEKAQKARLANASNSVKRLAKQGAPKGNKSLMSFFAKK